MSKALIFSDLHLHNHKDRVNRLPDCLATLEWVFKQAAEHGCDYIFFLGDLFHERAKIDVLNYLSTFEIFMEHMIETHMEMFLLVGNHDMYHKESWDVNSVKPLTGIPNISIIQCPLSIHLGGRKIDWLPHTEDPIKELDNLKKDGGAGDLLLGHIAINGAIANLFYGTKADVIVEYDNHMVTVDVELFDDWDMTILGHYHGGQKLTDKVEYVGSPLQLSFGEAFQQKHIIILDLETMVKEYIVNDFSPQHLIVSPQDIENNAYDLSGNFVRLAVDNLGNKDVADLQRKIATEYKPLSVDTKKRDTAKTEEEDTEALENIQVSLGNIAEMMGNYVKDRDVVNDLDKDHLLEVGMKCLDKQNG
jgi:DNA repair exonuclease SbcCD nuclease subunit